MKFAGLLHTCVHIVTISEIAHSLQLSSSAGNFLFIQIMKYRLLFSKICLNADVYGTYKIYPGHARRYAEKKLHCGSRRSLFVMTMKADNLQNIA